MHARLTTLSLCGLVLGLVPVSFAEAAPNAGTTDVTWVGFAQLDGASRVFVRTADTVKYSVDTARPDKVVVTLENARVPLQNNLRPLPTMHFQSPVTWVRLKLVDGEVPAVQLEISTRRRTEVRPTQKETYLAFDFLTS